MELARWRVQEDVISERDVPEWREEGIAMAGNYHVSGLTWERAVLEVAWTAAQGLRIRAVQHDGRQPDARDGQSGDRIAVVDLQVARPEARRLLQYWHH
jgi:hypothetical protein